MNKSEKDSCILFLMQPSQDRKLLEDFLEDTYRILPSKELLTSSSKVDLCIVDGPSFEQSKPMIAKIRKRSGDVFLPILLVTPRKDVRMVTANAWKQIDDIITSPIEKGELHARLVVLLRIRTLSKELVKQKEYELDRTREALQSSEDIRRALFNSTPLSTFALNLAGQVITWNPAAETMLGFSEEEAIGNQLPIIPENLTNEYNEFLSRLMNGDSFIGYEMKTRRKDGLVFDCSLSGAPIRGTENEIVGTIISMEDITQRKHIEGALSASEKKFRGVFSNDHTIMLIIDPSTGCIEDANPAAVSFYGWDKETLVGMKISDINTMSDTAVSQNLENARLKRQTIFEFRHKRAGGAVRDVEVHSGPIEIEGRSLLYSLVFDVTNKRAAELRLRDSLTEKETLLRELYHRTNNSMQTIHSIMSMYADTHSNSSLEDFVEIVGGRIDAIALVHRKLLMSNNLSRIDFGDYIAELARLAYQGFSQVHELVRLHIDVAPVYTLFDCAAPLGLAVFELLSNSLTHAFPDGLSGEISVAVAPLGQEGVEVVVKDNGVGMALDFDELSMDSVGIPMVIAVVKDQLRGEISFDCSFGTTVTVRVFDHGYKERV